MDPAAFSALKGQIQGASFDKDRLQALALAAPHHRFLCAQALELLRLWSFDPQRLEALAVLAPRLADPESGHTLLNAFGFDSHKSKASAILGASPAAPAAPSARGRGRGYEDRRARSGRSGRSGEMEMATAEFEALKQQVSNASFDHERDGILKLAARANYFTCAQAAELLGAWSFDPQRLSALEVIAPRLIDTEQRHSLLDLFDFDTHKARAAEILGGH